MNQLTAEGVGTMLEPHAAIRSDQQPKVLHNIPFGSAENTVLQLDGVDSQQDRLVQSYFLPQNNLQKQNFSVYNSHDLDTHNNNALLRLSSQDHPLKSVGEQQQRMDLNLDPNHFATRIKRDPNHYRQNMTNPIYTAQPQEDHNDPNNTHSNVFFNDTIQNSVAGSAAKLPQSTIYPGAQKSSNPDEELNYKNLRQQQVLRSVPDVSNLADPEFAMELVYSQFLFPYEKVQFRTLDTMISGQKEEHPTLTPTANKSQNIHANQEEDVSYPQMMKKSFTQEEAQIAGRDVNCGPQQHVYYGPLSAQSRSQHQSNGHLQYYPQNFQDSSYANRKTSVEDIQASTHSSLMGLDAPINGYRKYSLQTSYPADPQSFHPMDSWNHRASPKILDKSIDHEIGVSDATAGSWINSSRAPHQSATHIPNPSLTSSGRGVHPCPLRARGSLQSDISAPMQHQNLYNMDNQLFLRNHHSRKEHMPSTKRAIPSSELRRSSVNIPINQSSTRLHSFFPGDYISNGKYMHPSPKNNAFAPNIPYSQKTHIGTDGTQTRMAMRRDSVYNNPGVSTNVYQNTPMHLMGYTKSSKTPLDVVNVNASDSPRETGSDTDQENIDFDDVTVVTLKQHLRRRGLPSFGKKSQLVERLKSDIDIVRKQQQLGKINNNSNSNEIKHQEQLPASETNITPEEDLRNPKIPSNNQVSPSVQNASVPFVSDQIQQPNFHHPLNNSALIQPLTTTTAKLAILNSEVDKIPIIGASTGTSIPTVDPSISNDNTVEVQALLDQNNKHFDVSDLVYQNLNDYFMLQGCDATDLFNTT